jgi:D-alanyl-D-alanine carboxypeptidase
VVRKKVVPRRISVRNHNRLLWGFDGAIGGKTGYTLAAQKCFVGAVQRNGVTLIVSILGARDQWGDTKRLIEYGFENYDGLKAAAAPAGRSALNQQAGLRSDLTAGAAPSTDSSRSKLTAGYILQLASFREKERAESLSRQMSEKGFDAFVEPILVSRNETAYRVRVGPYPELTAAQETAQEILTRSGHRALILPFQGPAQESSDPS